MENKTLDYFITQKASEISGCHPDELVTTKAPSQDVLNWMDIAERYANYKAEQACIRQREICAENALIEYQQGKYEPEMITEQKSFNAISGQTMSIKINKKSILQAPLATESKKSEE